VPFWGDPLGTPTIEIGQLGEARDFVELKDGDPVDLRFPTQGGHVLYIAARVHNMSGCRTTVRATLKDPTGANTPTYEGRVLDFLFADGDGGIPDMRDTANLANVPVCPNYGKRDYVDQEYELEVTVSDLVDAGGRKATVTRRVRPVCRQTGPNSLAACRCDCQADFFPGKCSGDGGTSDGGAKDAGDGGP
jgi:hypothetical protein